MEEEKRIESFDVDVNDGAAEEKPAFDFSGMDENDWTDTMSDGDAEAEDKVITEWMDSHCVFCDRLDESAEYEGAGIGTEGGPDWWIGEGGLINVANHISMRTDGDLPPYIKFGEIGKDMYVIGQNLKTTRGFPKKVGGSMWMFDSDVEEITDFPEYVRGNCSCRNNKLKNLDGLPLKIGGVLDVADNDPGFKWIRSDGGTIDVGVAVYGSLDEKERALYRTDKDEYVDMAADDNPDSAALSRKIVEQARDAGYPDGRLAVSCSGDTSDGWVFESHGDI